MASLPEQMMSLRRSAAAVARRVMAYVAAMLIACLGFVPVVFVLLALDEHESDAPSLVQGATFVLSTSLNTTILLALPSALLISLTEWKAIRRLRSYTITGALIIGSFLFLLVRPDLSIAEAITTFPLTYAILATVLLASGAAGGAVYWYLAGRYAGGIRSS
jgi:hypothetical protein